MKDRIAQAAADHISTIAYGRPGHPNPSVRDAMRMLVGMKLRALGDSTFRLGLIVSEGKNAGIEDECNTAYRWGREETAVSAVEAAWSDIEVHEVHALAKAADMSMADLVKQVENRMDAAAGPTGGDR